VRSTDDIDLRAVSQDELLDFFDAVVGMFGDHASREDLEPELITAEAERTIAGFDDGVIVATAGCYTFDLAVPGGRLPAGGVSYVGVTSTHRRRGLLTRMMTRQLADIRDRGEALAVLWASEAAIYGRFGYGVATRRCAVTVDSLVAKLRADAPDDPGLVLKSVALDDAAPYLRQVLDAVPARPGSFIRDDRWVTLELHDSEYRRAGASPMRCIVALRDGVAEGYAVYHLKPQMARPEGLPNGEVRVGDQQAVTPAAFAALTRFLLSIDLMRTTMWRNRPTDTALPHLLTDVRRASTQLLDALHVRIIDMPRALTGRRYAAPVDVVLEVADELLPDNAGRFRLRGDRDGATCERTEDAADIRLGIAELGAAYLGETGLTSLAAAGRVSGDAERVAAVTTAFGWDPRPWCPTGF
jgi:predicted acetyltransferase